jgi:hypothetical protein
MNISNYCFIEYRKNSYFTKRFFNTANLLVQLVGSWQGVCLWTS